MHQRFYLPCIQRMHIHHIAQPYHIQQIQKMMASMEKKVLITHQQEELLECIVQIERTIIRPAQEED